MRRRDAVDTKEAATVLGMKDKEITDVAETPDGHVVTTHDGQRTLIHRDGSLTHGVAEPEVEVVGEVSDEEAVRIAAHMNGEAVTEAGEAGDDEVPNGTAAEVLDWVGEDQDRAERALHLEMKSPNQRTTLVAKLSQLLTRLGAQG